MRHTPGPWEVRNDVNELVVIGHTKSDYYPNSKREDGLWPKKIVLIKATRIGAKRGCNIGYHPFNETEQANARLIAAAPELLEALEDLIFQVQNNVPWIQIETAIKKGRQAIAKAEGN